MTEDIDRPAERPAPWHRAIRGNVLMMGLVSLFNDAASEMVYPLLPVFLTGLPGVGAAGAALYVGLMDGIGEATASLLKIASGRVSDALGKRKALAVIGYGLAVACRPLNALAQGGWHVIGLRFADRIGKGVRTAPRDALISDSVGSEARGLAFSFHRAMDHAGAVLGPLAALGILYLFLGYGLWRDTGAAATAAEMTALRWLFAIALVPSLAALAALVTKVREVRPAAARTQSDGEPPAPPAGLPLRFYLFVGTVTIFALGNSSDLFLLLYAKTKFGLDLLSIVGLWVALHAAKVVFSVPGGMLSDRFGRRIVIVAGWIVYALVYLGMARAAAAWQIWALMAAYGLFYGLTEGAEKALVADFVPSGSRGTAYGLYHGAVGLAALPASLLFGAVWTALGPAKGPAVAFGIGAGLAGLAAVLLIVLLSAGARRKA